MGARADRDAKADAGTRPGRARDERAHRAILDATARLVEERGYTAVTIEGIAADAGVGKTTIYRWWPSKAHLVLEVVLDRWYEIGVSPDTGSTRQDLIEHLSVNYRNQMGPAGPVMQQLGADLRDAGAIGDALRGSFLEARRSMGRTILERGIARGDLPEDADIDLMLSIAAGVPMAQQLATGSIRDIADVEAVVDLLLSGTIPRRSERD